MTPPIRSADVLATFHADIARLRSDWLEPWRALAAAPSLSTSPGPRKWSAIQCLEHVRRVNAPYVGFLDDAILKGKSSGRRPTELFRPGLVGARMTKSLAPRAEAEADGLPRIPLPMPTFGSFDPAKGGAPVEVDVTLAGFDAQLSSLEEVAKRLEQVDLHVRCKTLFPLLKVRLGDAVRFLAAHADRHRVQADRAMASV